MLSFLGLPLPRALPRLPPGLPFRRPSQDCAHDVRRRLQRGPGHKVNVQLSGVIAQRGQLGGQQARGHKVAARRGAPRQPCLQHSLGGLQQHLQGVEQGGKGWGLSCRPMFAISIWQQSAVVGAPAAPAGRAAGGAGWRGLSCLPIPAAGHASQRSCGSSSSTCKGRQQGGSRGAVRVKSCLAAGAPEPKLHSRMPRRRRCQPWWSFRGASSGTRA